MNNISLIERAFQSEKSIIVPHYLSCSGRNYAEYNGEIWRMYGYIENTSCIPYNFDYGFAVGRFLRVVNSYGFEFENPINLHDFRLNLPLRNIHGDTKSDNIIFGKKTAIIDLDNAMRSYICADYGDMIRSVTTESFDLQAIYDTTKGFAKGIGDLLTAKEISTLYSGIVLIITELKDRYHSGIKNFPNKTSEQCLEREKSLILQLDEFYSHEDEIKNIINRCFE